ncbi:MAG TPA: hypothetical protein VK731_02830 [Candidatus Cybelea sp.]|nr:hypothetical protein [Candidatus Cybelea sp.]
MLIVIAIIASLLLRALGKAKEQAFKTECTSNLKQWGDALVMYAGENREYFPDHSLRVDLSWVAPSFTSNLYPSYLMRDDPGNLRLLHAETSFSFCAHGLIRVSLNCGGN